MSANIKARLLEEGKEEGCVSLNFLNDLIPEGKDPDTIDGIFDFLNENNIEIVSQQESGSKKTLAGKTWKKADDKAGLDKDGEAGTEGATKALQTKTEPSEPEETTTTYLREMGRFDLLTPEEEEKYSKTIREGFDAIIRAIRQDDSGVPEITVLVERIALWEKRDPTLKPKKQHLNFMLRSVATTCGKHHDAHDRFSVHLLTTF